MDPALLMLPLGLLGVGAVAWLAWQYEKRHREALHALAAGRGWTYTRRDDGWAHCFSGTPFGRGDSRRALNVLQGEHGGRRFVAFDYSYTTSSTDSNGHRRTTTHRYAVTAVQVPAWLPPLELTPENVLTRIGGALGATDVELESEDFNRRYRVNTRDPRFAYDVLHPRTMQALLERPTVNLRLCGAEAISWDSGRTNPAELVDRLSTTALVLDGIPTYVWSDHRLESGGAP